MPPAKIATPPIVKEIAEFASNHAKTPYGDLRTVFLETFKLRLREISVDICPDATVLVRNEVLVGHDWDSLEVVDTVTMRMPPGAGPVTMASRVHVESSLIFLIFGRLQPPSAPATETRVDIRPTVGTSDIVIPPEVLTNEGGEYVEDPKPTLDLIERREPDGLPIFKDLYAMGIDTGAILDTLLVELEGFLRTASSPEQILAVYTKNGEAMQFLKDLGDDEDKRRLKAMLDAHKTRLTPPPASPAPRRRAAAH